MTKRKFSCSGYDNGAKHVQDVARCLHQQLQRTTREGARNCFLDHCRSLNAVMRGNVLQGHLTALISVVFSCTRLKRVDINITCPRYPPTTLRVSYELIARHIGTLALQESSVKVHLDTCTSRPPEVLDVHFTLPYLCNIVTTLEVVHKNGHFYSKHFKALSEFSNLRSLTFTMDPKTAERYFQVFSSEKNRDFWNAIELLPLEEIKFTVPLPAINWDDQIASLPKTLKHVNLEFPNPDRLRRTVKIMAILRQLPLLERFEAHSWEEEDDSDLLRQTIYPNPRPLEQESLPCHRLKTLQLSSYCDPEFSLQAILHHCPLLATLEMPTDACDDDILLVARQCKSLECITVNYFGEMTTDSLLHLRHAKNLKTIHLRPSCFHFYNDLVQDMWAAELPFVEVGDGFELNIAVSEFDYTDYDYGELFSPDLLDSDDSGQNVPA